MTFAYDGSINSPGNQGKSDVEHAEMLCHKQKRVTAKTVPKMFILAEA